MKNNEMLLRLESLRKLLDRTDIVGYAAARNVRFLEEELVEFDEKRKALIQKYGQEILDENGNPTGRIELKAGTPQFEAFVAEIAPFGSIEHEPRIFKLGYGEAIGKLSGSELLEFDWMFED